jgi:predicted RNase H-like nuclease
VVAAGPETGGFTDLRVVARVDEIVDMVERGLAVSVAIDMPIGLAETGRRRCDEEARRLLGPRRSSVFSAPARRVLTAANYDDACARSRAVSGVAISRQAWNLVPKIAELDARMSVALQDMVVEAHPEGSFGELGGRPCQWTKHGSAGLCERQGLLAKAFGSSVSTTGPLPGAAPNDVVDALSLLWTAQRRARGEATWVGDDAVDGRGLRMQIWR